MRRAILQGTWLHSLAGAGGIELRNNPLPHKNFSIPARRFDSIFDSEAKASSKWPARRRPTQANGWKASVVPDPSIIHLRELLWIKRREL
jgi:hypothetical protein